MSFIQNKLNTIGYNYIMLNFSNCSIMFIDFDFKHRNSLCNQSRISIIYKHINTN